MIASTTACFCLLEAVVARIIPGMDKDRIPDLVLSTCRWGLMGTGCMALSTTIIMADFLIMNFTQPGMMYEKWADLSAKIYSMAPTVGGLTILPTSIGWIWMSRVSGEVESA